MKYLSVKEIAETLGVSRSMVKRLFEREPGVLIIERRSTLNKRRYRTIRIPETVLHRVVERLTVRK